MSRQEQRRHVKIWPNNQTDHPLQVPQDITLGLLWPKFTHKYCIQKEIIKYKDKVPVNKKRPDMTALFPSLAGKEWWAKAKVAHKWKMNNWECRAVRPVRGCSADRYSSLQM